ncbi:MAG: DUF805 domain-containing protein, partial [Chloroflexota bacterium]
LYSLAVLIPFLAVSVRRLHDTNRSGWWLLLSVVPLFLMFVMVFIAEFLATNGGSIDDPTVAAGVFAIIMFMIIILSVASLIPLLIFFTQNSQPGENRYGPNPKQVEQVS